MTNTKKRITDVTKGSIKSHMIRLALPSIGGMMAITIFNLTDTYFVSKLGTNHLAAMGFTFPVVMIIGSISSGISIGAGSLVARATGGRDHSRVNRIATHGILLSIITVILVSLIGLMTMRPLFTLLGADAATLPLVMDYMMIWYFGVGVVLMPPVSDSYMRALGDMLRPSIVMVICAVMNLILDPIFIFGGFGFEPMGIQGAALATVVSRLAGMIASLLFVHFRYGLIEFKGLSISGLLTSWKEILSIGLPSVLVRLLPQLLRTMITRIAVTVAGVTAVAAIAAGSRIESFATIISMAVGSSLVPLIGQNFGAGKFDRIKTTRKFTNQIAVVYGFFLFLIALFFARPMAGIFTDNPKIIELVVVYLRLITIGTIGLNWYNWSSEMLNAAGKPLWTMNINLLGTIFVLIPLTGLGAFLFGFSGMIGGLVIGQIIVGLYGLWIASQQLNH